MRAEGVNGQVELDGGMVTISRSGLAARATVGKGDKRIPVKSIQAVQWKPASRLTRGFIQFSIGGSDAKGRAKDAARDENSVLFSAKQQGDFEAVRSAVEQANRLELIAAAFVAISAVLWLVVAVLFAAGPGLNPGRPRTRQENGGCGHLTE